MHGSRATSASGPNNSIASRRSSRRKHVRTVPTPPKPSLTLVRRLEASPARVFAAWTDPAQVVQWMGPDDDVIRAENDVRVGGRYRIVMRAPDGEEHDVSGVYREIVADTKLVFTWAWRSTPERESLVTIALRPIGDAHRTHAHPRAVLRRRGPRPPQRGLEQLPRQVRAVLRLTPSPNPSRRSDKWNSTGSFRMKSG